MQEFKKKYSLPQRQQKSAKQIQQNPGKMPIIAQPCRNSKLPCLKNAKFLCEENYKFSTVSTILAKKIQKISGDKTDATLSVFMFTGGKHLISADASIAQVYGKYKDEDGFLYISYDQYAAYG